jgi:hypothetical protein
LKGNVSVHFSQGFLLREHCLSAWSQYKQGGETRTASLKIDVGAAPDACCIWLMAGGIPQIPLVF